MSSLLTKLTESSVNAAQLTIFVDHHIDEIYDFMLETKHKELVSQREQIEDYILSHLHVLKKLNIQDEAALGLLNILLEVSERLGLTMCFQQIFNYLQRNNGNISSRLRASACYLIGIRSISDYENAIPKMLDFLKIAYEEEEDTDNYITCTCLSYIARVAYDFATHNLDGVNRIRYALKQKSDTNEYPFLNNLLVQEAIKMPIDDAEKAYQAIHKKADDYLSRPKPVITPIIDEFLIEKDTPYSKEIANYVSYESILQTCRRLYQKDDDIYYSLGRGVNILSSEEQLYAYMYSFGNMHGAKLRDAFRYLPLESLTDSIVIDWGCGQGIASLVLHDFTNEHIREGLDIKQHILIEPSVVALKRAALHVSRCGYDNIKTINKSLDQLSIRDFRMTKAEANVHLFSNILDIEDFSLHKLSQLVLSVFKGVNYVVIVSPYVNDLRTSRINAFVQQLSENNQVEHYTHEDAKRGEWINGWTKVVRVLKVEI
jgi:hypothetical protein